MRNENILYPISGQPGIGAVSTRELVEIDVNKRFLLQNYFIYPHEIENVLNNGVLNKDIYFINYDENIINVNNKKIAVFFDEYDINNDITIKVPRNTRDLENSIARSNHIKKNTRVTSVLRIRTYNYDDIDIHNYMEYIEHVPFDDIYTNNIFLMKDDNIIVPGSLNISYSPGTDLTSGCIYNDIENLLEVNTINYQYHENGEKDETYSMLMSLCLFDKIYFKGVEESERDVLKNSSFKILDIFMDKLYRDKNNNIIKREDDDTYRKLTGDEKERTTLNESGLVLNKTGVYNEIKNTKVVSLSATSIDYDNDLTKTIKHDDSFAFETLYVSKNTLTNLPTPARLIDERLKVDRFSYLSPINKTAFLLNGNNLSFDININDHLRCEVKDDDYEVNIIFFNKYNSSFIKYDKLNGYVDIPAQFLAGKSSIISNLKNITYNVDVIIGIKIDQKPFVYSRKSKLVIVKNDNKYSMTYTYPSDYEIVPDYLMLNSMTINLYNDVMKSNKLICLNGYTYKELKDMKYEFIDKNRYIDCKYDSKTNNFVFTKMKPYESILRELSNSYNGIRVQKHFNETTNETLFNSVSDLLFIDTKNAIQGTDGNNNPTGDSYYDLDSLDSDYMKKLDIYTYYVSDFGKGCLLKCVEQGSPVKIVNDYTCRLGMEYVTKGDDNHHYYFKDFNINGLSDARMIPDVEFVFTDSSTKLSKYSYDKVLASKILLPFNLKFNSNKIDLSQWSNYSINKVKMYLDIDITCDNIGRLDMIDLRMTSSNIKDIKITKESLKGTSKTYNVKMYVPFNVLKNSTSISGDILLENDGVTKEIVANPLSSLMNKMTFHLNDYSCVLSSHDDKFDVILMNCLLDSSKVRSKLVKGFNANNMFILNLDSHLIYPYVDCSELNDKGFTSLVPMMKIESDKELHPYDFSSDMRHIQLQRLSFKESVSLIEKYEKYLHSWYLLNVFMNPYIIKSSKQTVQSNKFVTVNLPDMYENFKYITFSDRVFSKFSERPEFMLIYDTNVQVSNYFLDKAHVLETNKYRNYISSVFVDEGYNITVNKKCYPYINTLGDMDMNIYETTDFNNLKNLHNIAYSSMSSLMKQSIRNNHIPDENFVYRNIYNYAASSYQRQWSKSIENYKKVLFGPNDNILTYTELYNSFNIRLWPDDGYFMVDYRALESDNNDDNAKFERPDMFAQLGYFDLFNYQRVGYFPYCNKHIETTSDGIVKYTDKDIINDYILNNILPNNIILKITNELSNNVLDKNVFEGGVTLEDLYKFDKDNLKINMSGVNQWVESIVKELNSKQNYSVKLIDGTGQNMTKSYEVKSKDEFTLDKSLIFEDINMLKISGDTNSTIENTLKEYIEDYLNNKMTITVKDDKDVMYKLQFASLFKGDAFNLDVRIPRKTVKVKIKDNEYDDVEISWDDVLNEDGSLKLQGERTYVNNNFNGFLSYDMAYNINVRATITKSSAYERSLSLFFLGFPSTFQGIYGRRWKLQDVDKIQNDNFKLKEPLGNNSRTIETISKKKYYKLDIDDKLGNMILNQDNNSVCPLSYINDDHMI